MRTFRNRPADQITAAARAVAQHAPETLTVARHRARPTAATIARMAGTAVFAYLVALPLPGTSRPVVAPLTALLVVQVTAYQTLRSAIRRVAAVVTGVLLAVTLSAAVGFTWWSLGIIVAAALGIGYVLKMGEELLEVPISAMLILSSGTEAAAVTRVVETLVGAAAGLIAGFLFAAPKVQPAEDAIAGLCRQLAGLLERMAAGLGDRDVQHLAEGWLVEARTLGGEIRRVDEALQAAEESTRLNPRNMRLRYAPVSLWRTLETLEHATTAVRVMARSLADSTRLAGEDNPVNDPAVREALAGVLAELAAALRGYGRLATEHDPAGHERLESELEEHLIQARRQQHRLSDLMRSDPAAKPVGWPLRGELISHLDRLRNELGGGRPDSVTRRRPASSWRRPRPSRARPRR